MYYEAYEKIWYLKYEGCEIDYSFKSLVNAWNDKMHNFSIAIQSLLTPNFYYYYKELLHYIYDVMLWDLNFIMFMNRVHLVNENQHMMFKWIVPIVHWT